MYIQRVSDSTIHEEVIGYICTKFFGMFQLSMGDSMDGPRKMGAPNLYGDLQPYLTTLMAKKLTVC